MSGLSLYLFGPPRIEYEGAPVELKAFFNAAIGVCRRVFAGCGRKGVCCLGDRA